MALISIIIPAYQEERNIALIANSLVSTMEQTEHEYELIFINDGSIDDSENILFDISKRYPNVFFINLSRNFGQQNALKAGYDYSTGDAVICMDADFQNPPAIIKELIEQWQNGFEIVVCRRKAGKQSGNFVKENTSKLFYKILSKLSDNPIDSNCPDFRLLDKKLVDIIRSLPESDIFLRGIVSWLGFKKTVVEYEHAVRIHGKTQYSFSKMLRLAESGLTGFSVRPLRFAIYLGIFFSSISLLFLPYILSQYLRGETVAGWTSLIATVIFLGGINLFILGVIGIYIGKLFTQSKQRPSYIVKNTNLRCDEVIENGLQAYRPLTQPIATGAA
ncbi:glycosyltransferase family 2 protein [Pedobacter jeongneungensis]